MKQNYGTTAQFGKKSQTGFLSQFKVWKTKESCMYFRVSKKPRRVCRPQAAKGF